MILQSEQYSSRWIRQPAALLARLTRASNAAGVLTAREWGMKTWKALDVETIMACGIFFMVVTLFWSAVEAYRHAFDFTDEAFYLITITSPRLAVTPPTQFGVFYHQLFNLLGHDVFLLRVVDMIFRYTLSFLLVWLVLAEKIRNFGKKHIAWAVVAGIAALSFMSNTHYSQWLGTPGYNTLNFEGLLVCMMGVVLSSTESFRKKYFGLVVAGLGCTLCFLAKMTSAALLLCGLSCYFFPVSKEKFTKLCIVYGAFTISLLISAWLISGSPYQFVADSARGYHDLLAADSRHQYGVWSALRRFLSWRKISVYDGMFFISGSAYLLLIFSCQKMKETSLLVTIFTCMACTSFIMFPVMARSLGVPIHFFILNATIIILVSIFYLFVANNGAAKSLCSGFALPLLFFLMPCIYALGTNTSYLAQGNKIIILPVIGIVAVLRLLPTEQLWRLLPPLTMSMLVPVIVHIACSQHMTYRDASIRSQNIPIRIGGGKLELSKDRAEFIENMREQAKRGGFIPGTPIINLSGKQQGLLYALEAEVVGAGWLGIPKSQISWWTRVFEREPQDKLQRSWVLLLESDKEDAFRNQFFAHLNLDFPGSYEKRAEWIYQGRKPPYVLYAPKKPHE